MKRVAISVMTVFVMIAAAGCSSSKPVAKEVMFLDLPEPVQKTFGERFPRAKLESIQKLTWKDGVTWYQFEFTNMGASRKIFLTQDGQTPKLDK